ncbi:MAG: chemotaxis response regulator protein-glutamate methylesterase [Oligoflexia bacterium]|nr:chemotaxis response regulator protein-glutamate methylesterase [Oligoflexia bacterium]
MITAIIADDSPLLRQVLKDVLEKSKEIIIVGMALNGKAAIELVKSKKPDILILDCEMPIMNGLEALKIIMEETPLPVFVFSTLTSKSSITTIKALELGAVDYLLKPTGGIEELELISSELILKIKHVVRKGLNKNIHNLKKISTNIIANQNLKSRKIDIITIGSSTGGVQASSKIIPFLNEKIAPIVWVQHMPEHFTLSFAKRLDGPSKINVKEAENGEILKSGTCYIAKGGHQMKIIKTPSGFKLQVMGTEKISGHCPSCDYLFESVAEHFSSNALALILTGMGEDGTKGLVQLHNKGAYVIGQNEKTCTVYGMPKSAFKAGAVDIELDIDQIQHEIHRLCGIKE